MSSPSRRDVLKVGALAGAAACAADFAFLQGLPALSAQEVRNPARAMARVADDIEPLVRLIEDTDRNRLLEAVAERIRGGTSYLEVLSALMLAGVRGIQPRPVGFKFHAVLVVNSAHQASQAARDQDRWLPLFWSIDNFKSSQARNRQEGDWRMAPVEDGRLPAAAQAGPRFKEAMDRWDEAGADVGAAALARGAGLNDVYEMLWRYGARDFRDIGHKAIYVANSYRTLQTIGWRHAEPILRSIAYALLEHEAANPADRDDDRDRSGRDNQRRLTRIRAGWQQGRASRDATTDFLAALRTANSADACERVVTMLNNQVDPASLWDGLFLACGELLMRQPGIVGLHTVTTMNALHFGYATTASDETRRYLLLQGAAFVPMFRAAMVSRGRVRDDLNIDTLEPIDPGADAVQATQSIFEEIGRDRVTAARKTLGLLGRRGTSAHDLLATARRLIFAKGTDSHDYKFSSAILEDYFHASPAWRDRFLATGMFYLRGSGGRDADVYTRTRAALGAG